PSPRFLDYFVAFAEPVQFDLPLFLLLQRFLKFPEGVDVLQLDLGAEFLLPGGSYGNVRVAPEGPLFHPAVGYITVFKYGLEHPHESDRFKGRTHVRLGNYLYQRYPGPVVIYQRTGLVLKVYELACV